MCESQYNRQYAYRDIKQNEQCSFLLYAYIDRSMINDKGGESMQCVRERTIYWGFYNKTHVTDHVLEMIIFKDV